MPTFRDLQHDPSTRPTCLPGWAGGGGWEPYKRLVILAFALLGSTSVDPPAHHVPHESLISNSGHVLHTPPYPVGDPLGDLDHPQSKGITRAPSGGPVGWTPQGPRPLRVEQMGSPCGSVASPYSTPCPPGLDVEVTVYADTHSPDGTPRLQATRWALAQPKRVCLCLCPG